MDDLYLALACFITLYYLCKRGKTTNNTKRLITVTATRSEYHKILSFVSNIILKCLLNTFSGKLKSC